MLKKVKSSAKDQIHKGKSFESNFPRSKKLYIKSHVFKKNVQVGMREISLDDPDIKSITTYDTSGLYTDSNYNHSYENGLKSIREEWLKNRKVYFKIKN